MEFLKANGIEDPGLMKEIDYQDVLNQQEIYGEELNLFANKEKHKEVSEWTYIYWYIYFYILILRVEVITFLMYSHHFASDVDCYQFFTL